VAHETSNSFEPSTQRGEFELIAAIRTALGTPPEDVIVGIGDDAAVLSVPPGEQLVVTTDMLVEGRHFDALTVGDAANAQLAAEAIGWKALAVSISDVAAMGGRSRWAVVSIALRAEHTGSVADALTNGLRRCAERFGVAIVGGDTTASPGPLVVNVTLAGSLGYGDAVLRSSARVGDAVCVTGALGGSRLGRHLHPQPRQDEALSLVKEGVVHAMIDLSDGLSSDLGHVLDASGVGAMLWADRVPIHPDAMRRAAETGRPALEHALHDGEDFELLFTTSADVAARLATDGLCGTPVAWIGRLTAGVDCDCVIAPDASQESAAVPLERRGYDHFRNG